MSSVLTLPKNMDDIQEATLLDEDWYVMRISKDPTIKPNSVLRNFMKENNIENPNEGLAVALEGNYVDEADRRPGLNWVIALRVVHDDPMINGRSFIKYLGIPNSSDKARTSTLGQTIEDEKMEKIRKTLEAFHGDTPHGNEAELEAGMTAQYYVIQEPSFRDENTLANALDINTDPIAV